MTAIIIGAVGFAWAAASMIAGILIGRVIRTAESKDRAPVLLEDRLYVADILAVKQVTR